jgi:hypothetical protein
VWQARRQFTQSDRCEHTSSDATEQSLTAVYLHPAGGLRDDDSGEDTLDALQGGAKLMTRLLHDFPPQAAISLTGSSPSATAVLMKKVKVRGSWCISALRSIWPALHTCQMPFCWDAPCHTCFEAAPAVHKPTGASAA